MSQFTWLLQALEDHEDHPDHVLHVPTLKTPPPARSTAVPINDNEKDAIDEVSLPNLQYYSIIDGGKREIQMYIDYRQLDSVTTYMYHCMCVAGGAVIT